MARNRKPAKVIVEPYRARAVRGPHKDGSGRWYWRAEVYRGQRGAGATVWTGWNDRAGIAELLMGLATGEAAQNNDVDPTVTTVRDLMECWVAAERSRGDVSQSWKAGCKWCRLIKRSCL